MTGKLEVIGSSVALVPRNALVESYAATNIPAAVARKKAGILDSGPLSKWLRGADLN
jgi:hypothetical protein